MSRSSLRTLLPFLAATSLILTSAACGSKAGSLTGPSAIGSTATATISGTVETGASASSTSHGSPASAAGFRVSVMNTGLSATTDQSGRFVISGVPSGAVTLRFEGPGVDARLNISGLLPGQTLTIGVQVAGGQAVLTSSGADDSPEPSPTPSPSPSASPGEPEHQNEISFKGAVEMINAPDLTVAGRLVHTTSATDIKREGNRIALTDLKIGEQVEVEGMAQSDGSILATKIRSENEDDNNNGEDNGGNTGGGGSDDGSGHD